MSASKVEGACLCGKVRFAITPPTKWCAHCHCTMCQRAHGAGFVTWVGVDATRFELTAGGETLRRYASSEAATRSFCGECGSPLFFESKRWPGEVHVARAAIPGEIDRMPEMHVFTGDRAHWVDVSDALPKRGGATGVEPI